MKSIYWKKRSKNSFIFWQPAGNDYRNLAINNNNFLKIGKFRPFFHPKKKSSIFVKNHVFQFKKNAQIWRDLQQNHWGSEFCFVFGCMHDYYYYYYYYYYSSHHVDPISMRRIKVQNKIRSNLWVKFMGDWEMILHIMKKKRCVSKFLTLSKEIKIYLTSWFVLNFEW
jgi:hypothetical protein